MAVKSSTQLQQIALPVEGKKCSGKHTTRLFIGEGNFSFTEDIIKKHDEEYKHAPENSLAHSIIATELKSEVWCENCTQKHIHEQRLDSINKQMELLKLKEEQDHSQNDKPTQCEKCVLTSQRIDRLKKSGVDVKLGFDGLKIQQQLTEKRFKRIHWNIPHDGRNINDKSIPPIIKNFFKACSEVQEQGDRIHMAIPYPSDYRKNFYQGYVYDITTAATETGYALFKKRNFDKARYPEYTHVKTNKNESANIVNEGAREFVFVKMLKGELAVVAVKGTSGQILNVGTKIKATVLAQLSIQANSKKYSVEETEFFKTTSPTKCLYYDCSTDTDSSGYEGSDSD